MNGYASNSKYTQLRQMVFILFINERLVDCQPIKKAIHSVYNLYMPKNTNYFVYMNLAMSPQNLDVNIHPTKHEVTIRYKKLKKHDKLKKIDYSKIFCTKLNMFIIKQKNVFCYFDSKHI